MSKSSSLYIRIEPELKQQAEKVLNQLNISASNAISMFYRQIVLQNGLPFELKLPQNVPDVAKLTPEQLDAEIQKGLEQANAGMGVPIDEAFKMLNEKSGI